METGKVVAGVIMLILVSILIFNAGNFSVIIASLSEGVSGFAKSVNGGVPTVAAASKTNASRG